MEVLASFLSIAFLFVCLLIGLRVFFFFDQEHALNFCAGRIKSIIFLFLNSPSLYFSHLQFYKDYLSTTIQSENLD